MAPIDSAERTGPRFALLGPLRVVDLDGGDIAVSSLLQRKILTTLLLVPRTVVSADALEFILWHDDPPKTARKTLHTLVSRLRRAIDPGLIVTRPPGYMIDAGDDEIDYVRLAELVNRSDTLLESDPESSLRLIEEATELWRGDAIAEFADEEFAAAEARRLDELRLVAAEIRFDALLAVGRHEAAIPELEAFIASHPYREKPRSRLMMALYRSGRSTEALESYQRFRELLVDELGLDPSSELQELELSVLSRDESLGTVGSTAPSRGGAPRRPTAGRRLPRPPALLGREGELDRLEEMAREPLTTVVGPGGVGKTSIVSVWSDRHPDVFTVELSHLQPGDDVLASIAEQLGMDAQGGDHPRDSVMSRLSALGGTLVIDNCEHLLDTVRELVADISRLAPELRVVCTSRQRLGLPWEQVLSVEPFHVTDEDQDANGLLANEAIRLFIDRAHRADSTFRASPDDLATVARICRLVDGLPLAIELAAARAPVFGLAELANQVATDVAVLEQGGEGRQRSLADVLDWSIGLLDDETRSVLATVALFEGGFLLDHLAEVHAHGNVVVNVGRLVDASLAYREAGSRPGRFRLHTPTRIHVRGSIELAPVTVDRFVSWGCRYVADICGSLGFPGESEPRRGLISQVPNIRATARAALSNADRVSALEIAGRLGTADLIGSPAITGLIDEIVGSHEPGDGVAAIAALAAGARSSAIRGRIDEALRRADRADELAEGEWHRGLHMADHARAWSACFTGDLERSVEIFDSIIRDERVPTPERVVAALDQASVIAQLGDREKARSLATEAYESALAQAGDSVISYGAYVLGAIELATDPARALESLDLAIKSAQQANSGLIERIARIGRVASLMRLGRDEEATGDVPELIDDLVQGGNWAQVLSLARVAATLAMRSGEMETAALLAHLYGICGEASRSGTIVNATPEVDDVESSFSTGEWAHLGARAAVMTHREMVGLVKALAHPGHRSSNPSPHLTSTTDAI